MVGDRVLVVGETAVRCLGLKDGSEQWKADLPGQTCGRGAVLGDTYLVPVADPKTGKGRIAVADLKGRTVAEVWDVDGPIGNLVVHEGHLLCQGLTDVAVFRLRVPAGPTGLPPTKKGG